MRIAHITPVYPPVRGGIGAVAAEYAQRLAARGIVVEVFTPAYKKDTRHETRDARFDVDSPVQGAPTISRIRPWYAWGFAALLPQLSWKLRAFDVIHVHHAFYGGEEFAMLASYLWRIPLVVTYHMRPKASGWVGAIMRVHRALFEPLMLRRAKKVLFASRDYAVEHGFAIDNEISNAQRFTELPFGVDTQRFSPGDGAAFRVTHGIPLEKKVMIFVGGLASSHYFKGVDVLLAAAARMTDDSSWHLLIVGDGDRRPVFEEQARKIGIADRVTFAGSVAFDDLPNAFRAADLHVLPSIDRSEAFGLVTLEAMATGIPSIVSDLPGMRSLVVPGETGMVVRPADLVRLAEALQNLLQQDGVRKEMGRMARMRVSTAYDADVVIDRLIALYNEV